MQVMFSNKKKTENLFEGLRHFFSEASGIRTPDNLIKSQVLYQLSSCALVYFLF